MEKSPSEVPIKIHREKGKYRPLKAKKKKGRGFTIIRREEEREKMNKYVEGTFQEEKEKHTLSQKGKTKVR